MDLGWISPRGWEFGGTWGGESEEGQFTVEFGGDPEFGEEFGGDPKFGS